MGVQLGFHDVWWGLVWIRFSGSLFGTYLTSAKSSSYFLFLFCSALHSMFFYPLLSVYLRCTTYLSIILVLPQAQVSDVLHAQLRGQPGPQAGVALPPRLQQGRPACALQAAIPARPQLRRQSRPEGEQAQRRASEKNSSPEPCRWFYFFIMNRKCVT